MISSLSHLATAAEALFLVPKSPEVSECLKALLAAVQKEERAASRLRFFIHGVCVNRVPVDAQLKIQQALRIRIAVADVLFRPLRQLLDGGDIASFSSKELALLYHDLPQLSDILLPEHFDRVSDELFQAIPVRFPGCTIQPPHTLVISAGLGTDLVAASSTVRFDNREVFCSFLAANRGKSFDGVDSLDLNFSESLDDDEADELLAVFPELSALHLHATTIEAAMLNEIVESSGLGIIFCRNCSSLESFQLQTWNASIILFFVGDTLPQHTEDVEKIGNVECVFVDKTRPLILDIEAELIDDDVYALLDHAGEVQELYMTGSPQLTDKAVCAIARAQPNLRAFSVVNCLGVTDKGISVLADSCQELESLTIAGSKKVTDKSLLPLIRSYNSLTHLDVGETLVTDTAVRLFLERQSHVRYLNLHGCEHITDEIASFIIEKKCQIDELWVGSTQFDPELVSTLQGMDSVKVFFCE